MASDLRFCCDTAFVTWALMHRMARMEPGSGTEELPGAKRKSQAPGDTRRLRSPPDLPGTANIVFGCGLGPCGKCTIRVGGQVTRVWCDVN